MKKPIWTRQPEREGDPEIRVTGDSIWYIYDMDEVRIRFPELARDFMRHCYAESYVDIYFKHSKIAVRIYAPFDFSLLIRSQIEAVIERTDALQQKRCRWLFDQIRDYELYRHKIPVEARINFLFNN